MKLASNVRADRYNFVTYLANGQLKTDLKRCFLDRLAVTDKIEYLRLVDGTMWELYLEPEVVDFLRQHKGLPIAVNCIVSFQVFRNGEQIAVARLLKPQVENRKQKEKSNGTV